MDSIIDAALEEICPLINGLFLNDLWPKLHSSILSSIGLQSCCTNVKKAIWTNLLNIPGLQFESKKGSYDPNDRRIQALEDAEKLNLKTVADDHLRNSFFGIYDIKITDTERRVLERLAIARKNGIAQNELAKEFGMKSNNIFHVVRNLELRGLIVRQSTIIKRNEICNKGDPKNIQVIATSMLYLHRYAKHLGCEQRLEVTKNCKIIIDDETVDSSSSPRDDCTDDGTIEDVHIADNLQAMQSICDKLEKADGKFLAVSDIKQEFGYKETAWRSIYRRLKNACLVEECRATVNKKVVKCLRLLKKFSPNSFEIKPLRDRYEDLDADQHVKLGKRGQVTDQLVELPIDHQFYNTIDSQGSKGLAFNELCKRLGISKRADTYLRKMARRFGLHVQEGMENGIRCSRVWTRGNFNPHASYILSSKLENTLHKNGLHHKCADKGSAPIAQKVANLTSKTDSEGRRTSANVAVMSGDSHRYPANKCEFKTADPNSSQNQARQTNSTIPERTMVAIRQSHQKYLCLNLDAVRAQREQWILQMLQDEKFLVKPELQKKLTSLEKEKQTVLDRKTLDRSLSKLQQEGNCKCIRISAPSVTNYGSRRTTDVLLHPSAYNVTPELLAQIYEKLRSFENEVRKKDYSFSSLSGNERSHKTVKLDVQSERSESTRASGFKSAKMVHVKLLHIFLWEYLSSSPDWDEAFSSGKQGYDRKNPHSMCSLFDLEAAIKAMPLQLFLQVVRSAAHVEDTIEKDRLGLCLSELPMQQYKRLMDTQATVQLSRLIDKLRRLKLIQLVSGKVLDGTESHATLKHSLELKPYIDEPVTMILAPTGVVAPDIRQRIRHNFVFLRRKDVEEYWNKLEYCRDPGSTSQKSSSNANAEKLHPQKNPTLKRKRGSEGNDISDPVGAAEQGESNEDDVDDHSIIQECALSKLKRIRQSRFSWTDNTDRQLVIEYVKHRVALGPNFHGTNWASLPNLPASMDTCRRRMAVLNSNPHFRKALMKFCNMLSERYIKHLNKFQANSLPGDSKVMSADHTNGLYFEEQWDDFENQNVKLALEEVLHYKKAAKHEASHGSGKDQYDCRHGKYIKLMKDGKVAKKQAYESLAICNAAELFKLVFLSTSVSPKLTNLFVETLKYYSEHDLHAAFNYLRERNIVIKGSGDSPFHLSEQFLKNHFSSPFPRNMGQRAAKMSSLLNKSKKELLGEGINLSPDIQCGEVFHLCALLTLGRVSIYPCLPHEGVGEADDSNTMKRKSSDSEFCDDNKTKKQKSTYVHGTDTRRDKGFPGIMLSLKSDTVSIADAVTLFKDGNAHNVLPSSETDQVNTSTESNLGQSSYPYDIMKETVHERSFITRTVAATESPWEAMTYYAEQLVSQSSMHEQRNLLCPDTFRNIYSAIEKAGEHGLSMIEISQIVGIQGGRLQEGPEFIVDVLEAFGHANKVNAYDSEHVVVSSYRSKYFSTTKDSICQESEADMESRKSVPSILEPENQDISLNASEVHKNIKEIGQQSSESQNRNKIQSNTSVTVISSGSDHGDEEIFGLGDSPVCKPILPWINADGTINQIVYKGLVRKVLGIVMQHPGILLDNVIDQMDVLNPQMCKKLLEMMILEKHIVVRKMYQATSNWAPPLLIRGLLRSKLNQNPNSIYREHLFANSLSTSLL